ncbi:D-aminoacyl-tRNA deacylase [Candidatus Woesearchaeota archaeon]|nr:D-aminoacyl-tRNA deacylase [Candidatus Woesearchaeota archaeon]
MKKFAIVFPYKFSASKNILNQFEKLNLPKNVEIIKVEKESIYNEDLDKEVKADYFIFATRHQSKAGVKSLCIHPIGNFSDAQLGGKEKELVKAMPSFMKTGVLELSKINTLTDFEIAFEATHHGPYLEKPCMFIEIGSSEKEWNNEEAGKIIAGTILKTVGSKKKYKSCVVLGGSHYNAVAKKIMLNTEYAVGHVCPKHNLKDLDSEMLLQMMNKSDDKSEFVVLDWKGLGSEKQRILKLLEENNVKYERYDKLIQF